GARRLAGEDAVPASDADQGGRPRRRRGGEMEEGDESRRPGVGPPGRNLHPGDVQERREAHLLQGRLPGGSCGALQLEPGRQHQARDRRPRGRGDRRDGLRGADPRSGQPQRVLVQLVAPTDGRRTAERDPDHGRRAKKTNSRPGRSGAPRISSTTYPCSTSAEWTSSRSRKDSVDSEPITSPSGNTNVQRQLTRGRSTTVRSAQCSTVPRPVISVSSYDRARVHSSHALRAGSRVSNTRYPPGRINGTERVVPDLLVGDRLSDVPRHRREVDLQGRKHRRVAVNPPDTLRTRLRASDVQRCTRRIQA